MWIEVLTEDLMKWLLEVYDKNRQFNKKIYDKAIIESDLDKVINLVLSNLSEIQFGLWIQVPFQFRMLKKQGDTILKNWPEGDLNVIIQNKWIEDSKMIITGFRFADNDCFVYFTGLFQGRPKIKKDTIKYAEV